MNQCQNLLQECIANYPSLSILALAYEFPPAFEAHQGRLNFLGSQSPAHGFESREFYFHQVKSQRDMTAALESLFTAFGKRPVDLVFIDHHHSFESLIGQVNACLSLAHPGTVFIFDDAVPPDIAFAGPKPTREWWVGEVWMLSQALQGRSEKFKKWIIDLPPTGMLAATGFDRIDPVAANLLYETISTVSKTAEIRAFLSPSIDGSHFELLRNALANASNTNGESATSSVIPVIASTSSAGSERSIEIDPARQWRRPPLDLLLDLSERNLNLSSLRNQERRVHGKYIDTFADATLTGFDGFVKDGTFYSRTIMYTESVARRHVRDRAYSRTILDLRDGTLVLPKSALENPVHIRQRIIFGTPDEPDNYGMWILYGVPSAHHFLARRSDYEAYFTYLGHPWQRKILSHLGISDCLIEHRLEKTYRCAQLTLVRHDVRNLTVSDNDRAIFREVADRFMEGGTSPRHERIYISRRSQNSRPGARGLVNEEELIVALTRRGFSIVEPEKLEFPDQIRAFAGARVIVGLGGAGLFNAVFAKPGTQFVTIESSLEWVDSHVNLFASCGLRCGAIIGCQDMSDPEPIHKRWSLNVPATVQAIDQFLANS